MSDSPEITIKDLWNQLVSLSKDIVAINQNVATIRGQTDNIGDITKDHEIRLREVERLSEVLRSVPDRLVSVERKIWAIPGVGTVISILALAVAIWRANKS